MPPRWLLLLCLPPMLAAEVRRAGPGQRYRTPCEAIRAAGDGDVVEIDAAGDYTGDVCAFAPARLTVRGVHGRPRIDAGGRIAAGKAIWVIGGGEVTVENIEFTGARCPDRNGAGIRFEGRRLVVRNCAFRRNENGILTANDPAAGLRVEYSEFDSNGYGDGYSHNIYVGKIAEFTMQFCWSHGAREGHLAKSRAAVTRLMYNLFDTGAGTASYEVNLPEGGEALLVGNVILQRPSSRNPVVISAGEEAAAPRLDTSLRLIHNTFVNLGAGNTVFVRLGRGAPRRLLLWNNLFLGPGRLTDPARPLPAGNAVAPLPPWLDPARFLFRPPATGPEAVPLPEELAPRFEYRHPACGAQRASARTAGALEAEAARGRLPPETPARCTAPGIGAVLRRPSRGIPPARPACASSFAALLPARTPSPVARDTIFRAPASSCLLARPPSARTMVSWRDDSLLRSSCSPPAPRRSASPSLERSSSTGAERRRRPPRLSWRMDASPPSAKMRPSRPARR